jgi:hypothetical protein
MYCVALRIDDGAFAAVADEVRPVCEAGEIEGLERQRHVISNVQVASPSVWHFVSLTVGSLAPWRSIDSKK